MENPNPFDLNEAIRRWQENLSGSPAFKADNLEELASHLRASVQKLRAGGLSEEEAFLIATRRIGQREPLEREFAKVNASAKWAMAAFWTVLGVFLQQTGQRMSSIISILLVNQYGGAYYRFFWMTSAAESGCALLLILMIHRMVAKSAQGPQFVRRCLGHPIWTILSLVGIATLVRILPGIVITPYAYHTATLSSLFIHSGREWLALAETEISSVVFATAIVMLAWRGLRLSPGV